MSRLGYVVATWLFIVPQLAARQMGEPASWYGIVPGISKEPNVIALYGPGTFEDTIGDTGSRTYVSAKDGSTLTFAFGFDKVVERIIWRAHVPEERQRSRSDRKVRFEPKSWHGWSPALIAGARRKQVVKWLDQPSSIDSTNGAWTYMAFDAGDCGGAYLTLSWSNDEVTALEMVAPADE